MSDRRRFPLAVSPALLVVTALIVITVVGVLIGIRGDRENNSSSLDIVPKIDPALIAYEQTAAWTLGMKQCRALAVGPDDSVYVGGDRTIRALRPDGTVLREIALDAPPQCLALSGSDAAEPGRLYVGMEDRVEVYDPQGKRIAAWKPLPAGAAISGIAAAERDVFVADAGNRIVWRFDLSGRRLGRIGEANEKQNYPGFLVTSRCFPLALGGRRAALRGQSAGVAGRGVHLRRRPGVLLGQGVGGRRGLLRLLQSGLSGDDARRTLPYLGEGRRGG